jgi:hypothetical protein
MLTGGGILSSADALARAREFETRARQAFPRASKPVTEVYKSTKLAALPEQLQSSSKRAQCEKQQHYIARTMSPDFAIQCPLAVNCSVHTSRIGVVISARLLEFKHSPVTDLSLSTTSDSLSSSSSPSFYLLSTEAHPTKPALCTLHCYCSLFKLASSKHEG